MSNLTFDQVKIVSNLIRKGAHRSEYRIVLSVGTVSRGFKFTIGNAITGPPTCADVLPSLMVDAETHFIARTLDDLAIETGWEYRNHGDIDKLIKMQANLKENYRKCVALFGTDANGFPLIPEVPF